MEDRSGHRSHNLQHRRRAGVGHPGSLGSWFPGSDPAWRVRVPIPLAAAGIRARARTARFSSPDCRSRGCHRGLGVSQPYMSFVDNQLRL